MRSVLVMVLLAATAAAQGTTRVSVDSNGVEGDDDSGGGIAISADGNVVAFRSNARNFALEAQSDSDVFVHDRTSGVTELISVDVNGSEANVDSWEPSISADGQLVAFTSAASDLVAGDNNGRLDIFVRDRASATTERVSVGPAGAESNGDSLQPAISADGRFVVFVSRATNLVAGDTNGFWDVFVHDRTTGSTERVNVDPAGNQSQEDLAAYNGPSISGDGRHVAFEGRAADLVAGDTNGTYDVFVRDRTAGVTTRVSVDSAGTESNDQSAEPRISADGSTVVFWSLATNLVAGDTNGWVDVFVHELASGVTERVSLDSSGAESNGNSWFASISADGSSVAFLSIATTLVDDATWWEDVYFHDRRTGRTELITVASSGAQANDFSVEATISGDGTAILFSSHATNLVANDQNRRYDVFVRQRCRHDASWSSYGAGFPGGLGVPSLTARGDPELGRVLEVDVGNSAGAWTVGLLFVGFERATISSAWGGVLLVDPTATLVIGIPPNGLSLQELLPVDDAFCGLVADLQVIESDPGAARGVSFSAGLELVLGH